jgi:peptidoglycan/LPS O-acetylase OafA/YrhL
MSSRSVAYRPAIDGLRAISVLLVLLNHAEIPPFSGGFIGVDVFFVISGFLISSIIFDKAKTSGFGFREFVERRFRRILPPLVLLLVVTTVTAHFVLVELDRVNYYRSLISAISLWPNIFFWQDTGYFDSGATYKPLLHTWSLGVEEQFYLVFPFLFVAVARAKRSFGGFILAMLAVASFLSMGFVSEGARFYLLPFRVWELMVGSLCALYLGTAASRTSTRSRRFSALILSVQSLIGIGIIVVASAMIGKDDSWPSVLTVLPVAGAVMVVADSSPHSPGNRLLSNPVFVRIGLWSYSIYLWHYPLFAFTRYRLVGKIDIALSVILIVVSIGLGWASWRFIERPSRDVSRLKTRTVVGGVMAATAVLLSLSVGVVRADSYTIASKQYATIDGRTRIVVVGDSHASHLMAGLSEAHPGEIELAVSAGCVPFWGVDRYDFRFDPGECAIFMNETLSGVVAADSVEVVVLASMGPVYISGVAFRGHDQERVTDDALLLVDQPEIQDRARVFEIGMRNTVHRLLRSGKSVLFVIDIPELGILPQQCRPENPQSCENERGVIDQRGAQYRDIVSRVAADFPALRVFDPTPLFCNALTCTGLIGDRRLYSDPDHLSEFGSRYVGVRLNAVINAAINETTP